MKHIVILTGGYLNIEFARDYLRTLSYDKVFVVDKGLEYADCLGITPDYIVGDFDTVKPEILKLYESRIERQQIHAEIERHPKKKDATDTELALLKAFEEQASCITILAATGSRLDHVLANVGLLLKAAEYNIPCYIVDEANKIYLLASKYCCKCQIDKDKQHGTYVSLIPMGEKVCGLTIEGVMYPLYNATLYQGSSLTVSNEITEEKADISIQQGNMLVIESKDI